MSGVFIEEVAAQTVEPAGNDTPQSPGAGSGKLDPEMILALVRREADRIARLTVD